MKKFVLACGAVLVLATAGCMKTSTLSWSPALPEQRSKDGLPVVWNVKARNCGLYLFYFIPIWSGKVTRPNRCDYELFRHNVNEWDMYRLLDSRLKQLDAQRVEDVAIKTHSSGLLGLWIFWMRSITAEGVAVVQPRPAKKNIVEPAE